MEREPQVRSVGQAESEEWEAAYQLTRRSLGRRRRRLGWFDWPEGPVRALDLAAGDGLDMELLGERCDGLVIGLDISARLLASARGARVCSDAHRQPFPDDSLDVVVANSVLHHLDPPVAFREIGRVLRPGGRLLLMEPRPCGARSLLDWITFSFPPGQLLPLFRARRIGLLEEIDVYSHWLEVYDQVPGWLADSGFRLEKERHTRVGWLAQWRRH